MTNHALTADATGSGGGVGAFEVIADSNGDQERLARAGEPSVPLFDVRPLRGIA
jgi:hypothetical protein